MKILSVKQIRLADEYTINNEPVSSINLMERAASLAFDYIVKEYGNDKFYIIFCGTGNNGGDGFVISRKFYENNISFKTILVNFKNSFSAECKANYEKLKTIANDSIIDYEKHLSLYGLLKDNKNTIIIDALFGSGLSIPLGKEYEEIVKWINLADCKKIAIDIPSGLFGDVSSLENDLIIEADDVITFQNPKLALLLSENQNYVKKITTIDINLHKSFIDNQTVDNYLIDANLIKSFLKQRNKFDHKGKFGHAALFAGSYGMCGAAVLSSKACLRSGLGLLTSFVPDFGYNIMQTAVPEAMVCTKYPTKADELDSYSAIGIGPGIGITKSVELLLKTIFACATANKPKLVIDADAINVIAKSSVLVNAMPENCIITPHPKEFERLFGFFSDDFERLKAQKIISKQKSIIIVYKNAHTIITDPEGNAFINNTGNSGMATAGSGDVLTGVITGLCARGYNALESSILGVYLHGLAGDIASNHINKESVLSSDIIDHISDAFNVLYD